MNNFLKKVIGAGTACLFLILAGSCLEQNPQVTLPESSGSSNAAPGGNEDIVDIVYMYPWFGTIPSGVDDVEAAINEITEEKISVHVTLKPVVTSSFSQEMSLVLAGNEKVDLATIPDDYMDMLAKDQLLEMNGWLETYGQGILESVGEFISGTTRDGKIYGVTVMSGKATSAHFLMRTDWLEETGIDAGQITPVKSISDMKDNLDVIEKIFEKVRENHPEAEICITSVGDSNLDSLIAYDSMGDNLGVILGGDSYTIENLYTSDEYRQAVELASRWNSLGYMMKDAAVNTATDSNIFLTGNAFCSVVVTQQGVEAQYKQTTGYDFTAVQVMQPLLYTGQNVQTVNALPICCQEPEAAVKFLNLMYTDKDVVNLLAYGIEGVHYRFMEDGTVDYPEGITAQNSAYPCSQTWLFGNTLLDYVKVGNVPDLYEIQAQANETAARSWAFGFIYDNTPVFSEVTECKKIIEEYEPGLLTGELDIKMLDEFNDKLEDAGINQIIQEKQRQFDTWLEENQIETE